MFANDLDRMAHKYGTDKCTQSVGKLSPKGYTEQYFKYFNPLRDKKIKLLEIGIAKGASLKMWEEFFPNAEIFGIDIDPGCKVYETKRTKVFIGDQTDKNFLKSVIVASGGYFDVVVDDGGHRMEQHKASLEELFPKLIPGGIYAIEDLHTAYWPDFGGGYLKEESTIEYLKSLVDEMNGLKEMQMNKPLLKKVWGQLTDRIKGRLTNTLDNLEGVHFYRSIAFLFKNDSSGK